MIHYRRMNAKSIKPATRAAMFRRVRTAYQRELPPPDLRHAMIEPIISRITPDVNNEVRIHLAVGVSLAMPPHVATDLTRFAVRLYRAHQCFVRPQVGSEWEAYINGKLKEAGLSP
jgi:hypothetical protein